MCCMLDFTASVVSPAKPIEEKSASGECLCCACTNPSWRFVFDLKLAGYHVVSFCWCETAWCYLFFERSLRVIVSNPDPVEVKQQQQASGEGLFQEVSVFCRLCALLYCH